MIAHTFNDFLGHNGDKPFDDDVTLIAARLIGPPKGRA